MPQDEPPKAEAAATDRAWDTTVPDDWLKIVAAWAWHEWTVGGIKKGWRKWGPCPRCSHTMEAWQYFVETIGPADDTVNVRCNCTHPHPGRPEKADGGCGVGSAATLSVPAATT